MPQLNYIKRILELIQMDKKDLEIKKIIFKEYDIPLTEKSINEKRGFKIRSKPNKKDIESNAENLRLVKTVIEKHNIDKTSKEIRALILQDYNLVIDKDEMKEILWTDLRKEITYDRKEYTYSLKSSYDEKENMAKKEQINNLALATLSPRIMFSINDLVLEKIQKFKISYYHSIPGYQTLEDNSAVEKLLISSLSKINIDKELSSTEENKYVLYGSISSRNFLNELKLVLQCFIRKQTKLNAGEINNYLKIVCNVELLTVDLKKLLASDLSYIFNRESIYYTAIKSKALNDLHEEVTNELFFYNLFIETFSTDGSQNKIDKVIADKKTEIIESKETSDILTDSTNTKVEKNSNRVRDNIIETETPVKNNNSLETKEIENNACKTMSELLPLSLFYSHIPLKKEFRLNISNVALRLELANSDLHDLKNIKKSILLIQNQLEDESDWELVYHNFKKGIEEQDVKLNTNGELLKRYAKNPFNYFLLLIESTIENISFDENIRFQKLLKEVCRDNVVTEAERELVFEKASYFGINHDKVELYLANEFRNYPSFIVLINEICEDGIITQKEREFIEEKAKIYKIPMDFLDKLISIGLFKVKSLKELKENIDFQEIVVMYLISSSLELDANFTLNINQFISTLHEKEKFENKAELLPTFKVDALKRLCDLLNDRVEQNLFKKDKNIEVLLLTLGLNNLIFNFSETIKKNYHEILNITLEGITYRVRFINIPGRPLFSYKYINCEYEIKINESHQILLEEKNRELMVNVIISIIASKSEFSSLESEAMIYKFINKFDSILQLK